MEIFNGFDVALPLPTRMLMGFSNFLIRLLVADRLRHDRGGHLVQALPGQRGRRAED